MEMIDRLCLLWLSLEMDMSFVKLNKANVYVKLPDPNCHDREEPEFVPVLL